MQYENRAYSKEDADYFCIYCPDNDKVYIVENSEKFTSLKLRIEKPRNNQEENIRWAADFELTNKALSFSSNEPAAIQQPDLVCSTCQGPLAGRRGKYCSDQCSGLANRRVERPSKETLGLDLQSMSWTSLGRKYGVSGNAVRKWAVQYGLV